MQRSMNVLGCGLRESSVGVGNHSGLVVSRSTGTPARHCNRGDKVTYEDQTEAYIKDLRREWLEVLARAEAAEAALAERDKPCLWTYSDEGECYVGECGNRNRYKSYFCGTCGHPVQVTP